MNCQEAPAASRCASLATEQAPLSRHACLQAATRPTAERAAVSRHACFACGDWPECRHYTNLCALSLQGRLSLLQTPLESVIFPKAGLQASHSAVSWQQQLERHCWHMRLASRHQVTLCCT